MDLETIDIFVSVSHRGSFSLVARERGIDPSSVSRSISGLEAALGVRLFQRSTRRLTLTEAGTLYLARVEGLVTALGEAGDEVRATAEQPVGTLRMTASLAFGSVLLTPLLPKFRAAYPQVSLDLNFSDGNLDLVGERIDLAIRLAPSIRADVIGAKLFDTRYVVCASPDYCASAPALDVPSDLRRHRCLRFSLPEFRTRWLFRNAEGVTEQVPVDGDVILSNPLSLLDCARVGMGPALLPNWLIRDDLARGALVACLPGYEATATSFDTAAWLLYPSRTFVPNKVRVMIDFLRRELHGRGESALPTRAVQ